MIRQKQIDHLEATRRDALRPMPQSLAKKLDAIRTAAQASNPSREGMARVTAIQLQTNQQEQFSVDRIRSQFHN